MIFTYTCARCRKSQTYEAPEAVKALRQAYQEGRRPIVLNHLTFMACEACYDDLKKQIEIFAQENNLAEYRP